MNQSSCEVTQICDSLNAIFRSIDVYGQILNSKIQSNLAAPVCSVGQIPYFLEHESPLFTKSDKCVVIPNLYHDTHGCIIFPVYERKVFSEVFHCYEFMAVQYDPDDIFSEKQFNNIPDLYSDCFRMWVSNIKTSARYLRKS